MARIGEVFENRCDDTHTQLSGKQVFDILKIAERYVGYDGLKDFE